MTEETISKTEAQDLVNAVARQRDDALNREAQLMAALAKAQRDLEALRAVAQEPVAKANVFPFEAA
jgi:hypothetical protein